VKPYWGLRDYGVTDQIGLEATPEEYVANMVDVFRKVRRVLRDDGTLWLNLGDSYASSPPGNTTVGVSGASTLHGVNGASGRYRETLAAGHQTKRSTVVGGLKPKDLVGIPWRVAFALQADGWYLRSDIIWAKPNPMPESVTDRPTKAHEYVFLLSKAPRYYFDQEAVREPNELGNGRNPESETPYGVGGRNIRSVWTIPTQPYPGAHFAVFPPALVEPCVNAGTSERGVCPECGAPWERVVERVGDRKTHGVTKVADSARGRAHGATSAFKTGVVPVLATTGWRPTCAHDAEPVPATVLDPFAGSGTVGVVANKLSRRAVLIDLNPDYLEQIERRNQQAPLGLTA
jgi:DNA modification methylase